MTRQRSAGGRTLCAALLLMTAGATGARAQDSHYWTYQYGTRAQLLGGAVVGSIKDLSATYYNPGAVAFASERTLLVTTDVLELERIRFGRVGGDHLQSSLSGNAAPGMFAATIPVRIGGYYLSASYLTRHYFDFSNSAVDIDPYRGETAPESGYGAGENLFDTRLNEMWFGLNWATRAGGSIGVGVTGYVAYRSHRSRFESITQQIDSLGTGSGVILLSDISYWHVRALAKLGVSVDLRPLAVGMTVTTAGVPLFGDGSILVNGSAINVPDEGVPDRISYLGSDYQQGLKPRYRSPWSVAAGASYGYRTMTLHTTAEYFGAVDPYDILDAADFRVQTTGTSIPVEVPYGLVDVINLGVGLDYRFSDRFSLYGGYTNDRSARRDGNRMSICGWDINHLTIGSAFQALEIDFTAGVGYSWGRRVESFPVGTDVDRDGSLVATEPARYEFDYDKLKFILGFTFEF